MRNNKVRLGIFIAVLTVACPVFGQDNFYPAADMLTGKKAPVRQTERTPAAKPKVTPVSGPQSSPQGAASRPQPEIA
jgi:hypothetical protein